ncbi:sigma 54-interacting transcriptional regulator [Methylobacterium sp. SyP6R]|uniref:sigma 54-interacting transcriptional regulator n=1 Tax=Methylobacterium sp. SyP6R TaxID=2718876 RepID=UPI001F00B78F|nr:sigma 54-interacting transcriptional regulator [Methylobacterium sp. SyP6R]MCF4129938.1 sigma 54-interacting transcriptional regulator [Methylobacterium sp. SyP6R]
MLDALAAQGVRPAIGSGARDADALVGFTAIDEAVLDAVRRMAEAGERRVIALSCRCGKLDSEAQWRLLAAGAADVLAGPAAEVAIRVRARLERWACVDALMVSPAVRRAAIGASPAWRRLLRGVVEVAHFTQAPVLLVGESGTGKELVGRLVHDLNESAERGALAVVDCTTIVPELAGSELFGHERGAFTGAHAGRDGAFATAQGGTLFLDEVGDLPLSLQAQLLRVAQEGTYKRVGSDTWRHSRFRLVSATHRDLPARIEAGQFRQDLYFRIAGWVFRVPPLRERRDDILPLARHFLAQFQPALAGTGFDPAVTEHLLTRAYPGNVRDLRQLMARISSRHVGPGPITVGSLPPDERASEAGFAAALREAGFEGAIGQAVALGIGLKAISRVAADTAMRIAMQRENGNLQAAARSLRVTDRALQLRRAAWRAGAPGRGSALGTREEPGIAPDGGRG